MNTLTTKRCLPCEVGTLPLEREAVEKLLKEIPEWEWKNYHHLQRRFNFKDFAEALAFVNKVGALAEKEGHHPDIEFGWGYVAIKLFTHNINGLSENDFIVAAKINQLVAS
ncbi:MAG: 4a-hydroxytetrahydrobiopterin dehydratase [bacterium]|nr:4a-hydroxytetrahydrobiopterin dehydratase [bacterium]